MSVSLSLSYMFSIETPQHKGNLNNMFTEHQHLVYIELGIFR